VVEENKEDKTREGANKKMKIPKIITQMMRFQSLYLRVPPGNFACIPEVTIILDPIVIY
jgi:hypothetical protein